MTGVLLICVVIKDKWLSKFYATTSSFVESATAYTYKWVWPALDVCRESKRSAQQILNQLEQLSLPLLESINSKLQAAVTYDAALSSWQELYRLVSCLDFGSGLATGCATLQLVSHSALWKSQTGLCTPVCALHCLLRNCLVVANPLGPAMTHIAK